MDQIIENLNQDQLQDTTEYDDPSVFPEFTEKDGIYTVDVNVETGVIEEIYYESGMGGNG